MSTTTPPATISDNQKNQVIVLAGPTAVGKSDIAAHLCATLPGLIVSADSVQAYRGVHIGANKPSQEERQETPHLLVDVVDAESNYNAAEWQRDALYAIRSLLNLPGDEDNEDTTSTTSSLDQAIQDAKTLKEYPENKPITPIVVGGTMMYLQWLVHGRPDAARPPKEAVEQAHQEIAKFQQTDDFPGALQHVAQKGPLFEQRLTKLCGKDWYRLRRTLEIALTVEHDSQNQDKDHLLNNLFTGERQDSLESHGYDVRCFFLCPNDRMAHTKLVDERCEVMIERGLLKETTDLQLAGQLPEMAARAIGYRQTLQYLERENPQDKDKTAFQEYLNVFTTATRQYSKKQMQWFRKDKSFVFVPVAMDLPKEERVAKAAQAVEELIQLERTEFDKLSLDPDSMSTKTRKENEAQGKGMKFYQMKRYRLLEGTEALKKALEEADRCTNQLQSKKKKTS